MPLRTEITRFPHAVLEVKLSLKEGQVSPPWVQEMIDSGYLVELHKFSKFIHGTATLFPEMVSGWLREEFVSCLVILFSPYLVPPSFLPSGPRCPLLGG